MGLTDTAIKRSRPAEKPYKLADGKGLYLLVNPSGSKLWRWKYRHRRQGKAHAFRRVPRCLSGRCASPPCRSSPLACSGLRSDGRTQGGEGNRHGSGREPFSEIAVLWFDHWKVNKSSRHVDATRRRLEANVFPAIGARPIALDRGAGTGGHGQSHRGARRTGYCQARPGDNRAGLPLRHRPRLCHAGTRLPRFAQADVLRPHEGEYARMDAKELPDLLGHRGLSG